MNDVLLKYQKLDTASKEVVEALVELLFEKKVLKKSPKVSHEYAKKILKVSVWSEADANNIDSKKIQNWQIAQW